MPGALEGITVVAIEQAVAAPFCTMRLAEAGARVIKVEREGGDFARDYDSIAGGDSAYFVWLNGGKESIVLDLKAADDAALLRRMVDRADILIQNLAPGAVERLGLDAATLKANNERLITCDISGYGPDGAYRDRKAYDLLIQCDAGLASITGTPDAPGRVGVSVADIACGMYAHAAILEALIERGRTGKGRRISISLFDAVAHWMAVPLLQYEDSGELPVRVGINHPSIAPYGVYRCSDGAEVVLAVQNEREWRSFCATVLNEAAIADDPRFARNVDRVRNRAALDAIIAAALSSIDEPTVMERTRAAKIAFAAINSVAELARHPHLRRVETITSGGSLALVASPPRWLGMARAKSAVPALDEHAAALRAEFA